MEDSPVYIQLEKRKGKKEVLVPRTVENSCVLTVCVEINWKVSVKESLTWLEEDIMTDELKRKKLR